MHVEGHWSGVTGQAKGPGRSRAAELTVTVLTGERESGQSCETSPKEQRLEQIRESEKCEKGRLNASSFIPYLSGEITA